MRGGIKLTISGFEKLLEEIQQAGGSVDVAAKQALRNSADIVESELKAACNAAGVPSSISSEIKSKTKQEGNRYSAEVGWEIGNYNPRNLSAGYKAAFLNYGAPGSGGNRTVKKDKIVTKIGGEFVTLGKDRGRIPAKNFIAKAKESSAPKVKKEQRQMLNKILKGLKK